ncbi:cupin, partial [Methylobacterium sp. J-026]|nr:cupin [Methylobacterium sp. J-026]
GLTFAAHTVIAPRTEGRPETLTILSGSLYPAHGRTLYRTTGAALTSGGFLYRPEEIPHSLWPTCHPVELPVNGSGPFGLNYIDPADDPSRSSGGPG